MALAMFSRSKTAIRRLMKDQQELVECPVQNVSAAPLESDMFEWHCNIQQDKNTMYHVILFFPNDYPYSPPSAEFVPTGMYFNRGAIKRGKKGDQICLDIFSDYRTIHTEWAAEKKGGWSPGYTVQTVLLNVISFLADNASRRGVDEYQKICHHFKCPECGHTYEHCYPPLNVENTKRAETSGVIMPQNENVSPTSLEIVDYISKEKFEPNEKPSENEIFGYGLVLTQRGRKALLTTPCEFLTSDSFHSMKRSNGVVHSIMKETLSYFMPLYINILHGSEIKNEFERTLKAVAQVLFPQGGNFVYNFLERWNIIRSDFNAVDVILALIPNLMCSTVVEFSKGSTHTSDNSLHGYFALHRLFIWAMEIYPELETDVEKRLESFVTDPGSRNKDSCPDIGQWLMLLSVSKRFTWKSVAQAYLDESYKRSVMWYIKKNVDLANIELSQKERLKHTFKLTKVGRNLLAFQVVFLKVAKPDTLSVEQIVSRYEECMGFPSPEMITEMKEACQKINSKTDITHYHEWYHILGLRYPSDASLFKTLKDSVIYAKATKGYHFIENP